MHSQNAPPHMPDHAADRHASCFAAAGGGEAVLWVMVSVSAGFADAFHWSKWYDGRLRALFADVAVSAAAAVVNPYVSCVFV
jgi:hypothetical protein